VSTTGGTGKHVNEVRLGKTRSVLRVINKLNSSVKQWKQSYYTHVISDFTRWTINRRLYWIVLCTPVRQDEAATMTQSNHERVVTQREWKTHSTTNSESTDLKQLTPQVHKRRWPLQNTWRRNLELERNDDSKLQIQIEAAAQKVNTEGINL